MFVSCYCCVLSGTGLCVGLITRPEVLYRVRYVQWVWSRSPIKGDHVPESGRSATEKKKQVFKFPGKLPKVRRPFVQLISTHVLWTFERLQKWIYRLSLSHAVVAFRKIRRNSNIAHVEIEYTYGQLRTRMHMQGRVPELQAATHWKLTGCSITALPPLLSTIGTRISSATFVSVAFHSGKEKFGAILRKVEIYLFYFLKLRDSETA